jgi:hypothetical protein
MNNGLVRWMYDVFLRGYYVAKRSDQNNEFCWIKNGCWCSYLNQGSRSAYAQHYAFVYKYSRERQ